MNQAYARVNQPYATLTLASALREMFGVQLYNNARALLSRILSILNLDWLQHARSVRGVYEYLLFVYFSGKSACTVVTLGNWDWFAEWQDERVMKRGDKYEAIKDKIAKRMWDQVCAYFPQLKDKVMYWSTKYLGVFGMRFLFPLIQNVVTNMRL